MDAADCPPPPPPASGGAVDRDTVAAFHETLGALRQSLRQPAQPGGGEDAGGAAADAGGADGVDGVDALQLEALVTLGQTLAAQLAGERAALAADFAAHRAHVESENAAGRAALDRRRAALDREVDRALVGGVAFNDRVQLNVGGVRLSCMRAALTSFPDSMLGRMFGRCDLGAASLVAAADDGAIFIDRDGERFRRIVDFLQDHDAAAFAARIGQLPEAEQCAMKHELKFFGLAQAVFGPAP
mmetsp:Transcript_8160/g.28212  ORF Transcript_8160/g.28212 Transcript_8160/m.28212 type:complete len:243 (-) Transcript_8160:91-819(-)